MKTELESKWDLEEVCGKANKHVETIRALRSLHNYFNSEMFAHY